MATSISVVIPSFNQGAFLEEALSSVMEQAWPATELIVVDGGSSDGTRELIEANASRLAWWCSEPDGGQGHAVNKGLERCTGDLVAFIGADDVYLPGAFQDAAGTFEANPGCGAVAGGFIRIDESSRVISDPVPAAYTLPGPADLAVAPPGSWRLHQVSTFYSRRALDTVGRNVDENLRFVLDRELLNRVCRRFPVATSPRVYAAFRHHASSKSTSEIVPFSRELAALHLRDAQVGEPPGLRRRRRALARRQLGAGRLKLARATAPGLWSVVALGAVPLLCPSLVFQRTFVVRWLEALGMAEPVRKVLGKPPPSHPVPRPLSEVIHEL